MKAVVLALILAGIALSACGSGSGSSDSGPTGSGGSDGTCAGGCLCIHTEQQCAAEGCYLMYLRGSDGSSQFTGCLNGPPPDASSE
jgi:hypothetical protein